MQTSKIVFLTCLSVMKICEASQVEYKTLKETTRPPGCYYKGNYYRSNSEILSVEDKEENLCYGLVCNDQGDIIHWDDFKCFTRDDPELPGSRPKRYIHTPPQKHRPRPRPRPPGCEHNDKFYRLGEEISRGVSENWCFGMVCGEDGQLIAWDNWDCFGSSTTTTTGPPPGSR